MANNYINQFRLDASNLIDIQDARISAIATTVASGNGNPVTSDAVYSATVGKLGTANGIATLDSNGKVPSSQLPSYVDDVLEYASKSNFPTTGETGKIYVSTDNNKTWRWSGTDYVEISASLALGETSGTAYRGDRGKTAYDHSQDSTKHIPASGASGQLLGWNSAGTAKWVDAPTLASLGAASSGHTHGTSIATSTGTNQLTLAHGSKYAISAGGTSFVFTMPTDNNTTYNDATTTVSGLMSASDKAKLDGIAANANNYSHPSVNHIPTGGSTGQLLGYSSSGTAKWVNAPTLASLGAASSGHTHSDATTSVSGLMSASDKAKLDGIAANANNYSHPTGNGNKHIPKDGASGQLLGWDSAGTAKWVDAPTLTSLSAASSGHTHGTSISTSTGTNQITLAHGSKYAITAGGTSYVFTMPAGYSHPTTAGNKHVPSGGASGQLLGWDSAGTAKWVDAPTLTSLGAASSGHTHSDATTSVSGLMSASDKAKLDGIAAGANNYSHPTSTGNKHIPSGGASGKLLGWSADGTAAWVDKPTYTYSEVNAASSGHTHSTSIATSTGTNQLTLAHGSKYVISAGGTSFVFTMPADNNTTYNDATTSVSGLMSASDKSKLDGIAANANNYSHPTGAGNKHVPSGGSTGQLLGWDSAGTAKWVDAPTLTSLSAASSGHTHTTSIATSTASSSITLAHSSKYVLTAGGTSFVFTMPAGYSHPTTAGNKHVPSGGSSGQLLGWDSAGTAKWVDAPTLSSLGAASSGHTHSDATTSVSGLMSASDKSKLDGIAANANNYSHPTTAGNKHVPAGGASGKLLGWSADGTAAWVDKPTYTTTIATSTGTNQLTLVHGSKYSISAGGTSFVFTMPADNNTTYNDATTSVSGLMSASDKSKLDGIANNANNYSHPTTSGNKHVPSGGSSGNLLGWDSDGTAKWVSAPTLTSLGAASSGHTHGTSIATSSASNQLTLVHGSKYAISAGGTSFVFTMPADNNTTYSDATQSAAGLMSASDKAKLDGIAANANNYSHPTGAGNNHIPTGGSTGQLLGYSSSGTATWVNAPTLTSLGAASSGHTHTTSIATSTASSSITLAHGSKYSLNAGGTSYVFTMPAGYSHPTSAGNKHVPSGGASGNLLGWDSDGTAKWVSAPTLSSLGAASSGHTHSDATTSVSGFMSAADKLKLDRIQIVTSMPASPDANTIYIIK